jgi:A/G-specific adenine glycosylase
MLQQTQVDRVSGKFIDFIERFPDISTLADTPLGTVLAEWQGLGYNRRAVALWKSAAEIVHRYNGVVPDDPGILRTLPGIGPATAASIAAFAYNQPVLFLETNIRTVFIHHFFNGKKVVNDTAILPVANAALDRRNPRRWYSALMDYGAMLKKSVGNLTRLSSVYRKQSPFAGSRRQLRGAIVKLLLEKSTLSGAVIAKKMKNGKPETLELLDTLVKEGLLAKIRRCYRIAG